MRLVDDRGRLLGLVNVVDALALLLVAAVVVAGVAFVLQPDPDGTASTPSETATVEAVVDLGPQSATVARRIQPGDTYSPDGVSNLTVTDVHVAPHPGGVRTILEVELAGPTVEGRIAYDGGPPVLGRQLDVGGASYRASGLIREVGSGLDRGTTRVLLAGTVDASTATVPRAGDSFTLAGREVATVESVSVFATRDPDRRRVFLGVALRTIELGDGPRFGGTRLARGVNLTVRGQDYAVTGPIERVGAAELPGEPASRVVTLEREGIDPAVANSLRAGMTETVAGQTNARITAVESEPSTILVPGGSGQVVEAEHPDERDVTIEAELSVRETDLGPTFKARRLQVGRTVHLDLGSLTLEATVTAVDEGEP